MIAIILAAGVGRRLGETDKRPPKSLLRFGGKSLLQRHIEDLQRYGIEQIYITVGHQVQAIEDEIGSLDLQSRVTTVYNHHYIKGSVISLWSMRDQLTGGEDIVLMDTGVLYDDRIIEKLTRSEISNCFLLDRNFQPGDEPVKICIRDGIPIEFRKQIPAGLSCETCGESVGFFRFSSQTATRLFQSCKYYVSQHLDETPYEEAIRDLRLETPTEFGFLDITGLPWIEIDFPEDIERAERTILPQLTTV
ncbi:MAG: phosphocholine cytidylyltransferase family protein [Gammaproteobacteria bacterium]|nr:phosphocholine cytidylyltransferase family protein [Gammaproteobacteria bacterium]